MQENNASDFKGDFERLKETWDGLEAGRKTPEYFASLFSVEGGGFDNLAELKAVFPLVQKLIGAQEWTPEQKAKTERAFLEAITPELKKDFTPYNVEAFKNDIKSYDPSKEYAPSGMKNILFQHGTLNLIAARPSRGKTSLAVSLLLDALRRTQDPVIFLTLEESNKQIYTRLFNAVIFNLAKETEAKGGSAAAIFKTEKPRVSLWNALKDPNNQGFFYWSGYAANAEKRITELEKSGRLQVIDFAGKNIAALERLLAFNKGAIVFIDYIQLIRPDPTKSGFTTLDGFNDISKRLMDAAKENEQTIIAAAQLRRLGEGASDSDNPESLNDTQLKDCGQFEQDANTIIALGRNTEQKERDQAEHDSGEPFYFWKIIKNRDAGGVNKCFLFDTAKKSIAFSFLQSTETAADFLNARKAGKEKKAQDGKETTESKEKPKSLADIANGAW